MTMPMNPHVSANQSSSSGDYNCRAIGCWRFF
jgi:hypothetical protein